MISFVIPVVETDSAFWRGIEGLNEYLLRAGIENYETIIIPNGPLTAQSQSAPLPPETTPSNTRLLERITNPGKGRAVKEGFSKARGDYVVMIDADLPYDLEFIQKACTLLRTGADLIYGNRRHPESYFRIRVPTLHLAFRRHCFGRMFNFLARWLLGVRSYDTQAGIKALSRRLAQRVALSATCPGFLFDLEIFLIAQANDWKIADVPVQFILENEKSSVRLINETLAILSWLPRIRWNALRGHYLPRIARSLQSNPT